MVNSQISFQHQIYNKHETFDYYEYFINGESLALLIKEYYGYNVYENGMLSIVCTINEEYRNFIKYLLLGKLQTEEQVVFFSMGKFLIILLLNM